MIKDNFKAYWHLSKSVLTISRVMAFEKFTAVFFFFYLVFVLSLAFILSVLHWAVAVAVVVLGLVLFVKTLNAFEFLKRALIRKGDRVEYADPSATENVHMFKTATVILKMRLDEVKKTKLISDELMQDNQHFYLVETDKKPSVIAYDWVIGLAPEILELKD